MFDWDAIGEGLTMVAFAQALLAAALLIYSGRYRPALLPLAAFFIANSSTDVADVVYTITTDELPNWIGQSLEMLGILGNLALPPCLWLYIRCLTNEGYPEFSRRDLRHAIPFVIGVVLAIIVIGAPPEMRERVLGEGEAPLDNYGVFMVICFLFVLVMFYIQAGVYIFAALYRLAAYRARLKDVFASTENREMRWISVVGIILVTTWLYFMTSTLAEIFWGYDTGLDIPGSVTNVLLIGTLAIWGLRQKPGFEPVTFQRVQPEKLESGPKYERSALSPEQSEKIALKIKKAMKQDQLYRDPNLSLWILSKHIAVTSNYVSQTLNMTMGETFFDYVNRWRVEDAKRLVIEDRETVLAIAYDVGFNSRSSFYTAFKRETGMTPTQFKQQGVVAP